MVHSPDSRRKTRPSCIPNFGICLSTGTILVLIGTDLDYFIMHASISPVFDILNPGLKDCQSFRISLNPSHLEVGIVLRLWKLHGDGGVWNLAHADDDSFPREKEKQ
jgi:hypothetical protein